VNETGDAVHFKPLGWQCVTPRIVTRQPRELVQFIKRVFAASGDYQDARPTVLGIGDSRLMISDAPIREAIPAFLYVYVPEVDNTYRLAVEADAESLEAPADLPYGDRRAMVRDPWGNIWQIATYLGES
jgi:uncharacterized glyoxalase superfamily protein PhnB